MSELTAPNGTPVISVGRILVVQHSNTEGTGTAFSGLAPKPGGADFHMVYDYRQRFRYRINTIVGKGAVDTDYFASAAVRDDRILRAEADHVDTREAIRTALAADTDFRRLDDPHAVPPCKDCGGAGIDADGPCIGYAFLATDGRRGGILLDPGLAGSSFELNTAGLEIFVPAVPRRSAATFAVARDLFGLGARQLEVLVDGRRSRRAQLRASGSMVTVEIPLDGRARQVTLREGLSASSARRSTKRRRV